MASYCEPVDKRCRQAFTLMEMVIVIMIIALFSGALIEGQIMIRTSQVSSVIGEMTKYSQAVNNFMEKFHAPPGDLPNATSYWGTDPLGCPAITTGAGATPYSAVKHKETCNGDGNGLISPSGALDYGGYVSSGPGNYESYRAWQQLADAGMVDNTYTGITGPTNANNAVIGSNIPASRVAGAGYMLFHASYPAGDVDWWPIANHVLAFGTVYGTDWTFGPALTPAEAAAIDSKIDDGLPSYGKVITFRQSKLPDCNTTDVQSTAQYNSTYTGFACNLIFDLSL